MASSFTRLSVVGRLDGLVTQAVMHAICIIAMSRVYGYRLMVYRCRVRHPTRQRLEARRATKRETRGLVVLSNSGCELSF